MLPFGRISSRTKMLPYVRDTASSKVKVQMLFRAVADLRVVYRLSSGSDMMNNYTVTPRSLKRKTISCRKGNFSTAMSDPIGKEESDDYSGRILGR